jgi:hypothetical protein
VRRLFVNRAKLARLLVRRALRPGGSIEHTICSVRPGCCCNGLVGGPSQGVKLGRSKGVPRADDEKEYPRPKSYAAYKPGHTGTAKAREDYYRNCVAKEGNIVAAEPR